MIQQIEIGAGRILAVPAVHYVASFAAAVNQVFRNYGDPPKAVAVELGQGAVDAISDWFREMGMGLDVVVNVPTLFGLTRENRLIHPRYRQRALELQKTYGAPLERLPQEILSQNLKFASGSMIGLSATDSIIEAIRCAVEWDVPVFGVDLEEYATPCRERFLIEDPRGDLERLDTYAARNALFASRSYDSYIDSRREATMAARLKYLSSEFDTLLFTGGLAHWDRLVQRIQDPKSPIASEAPQSVARPYNRVLMAPTLALQYMDVLPEVTTRFEQARFNPHSCILPDQLYKGLKKGILETAAEIAVPSERGYLAPFFQFLNSLCLVERKPIPSVYDCMSAARAMVSKEFAQRFGRALMERNIRWTKPKDRPDLPLAQQAPDSSSSSKLKEMIPGSRRGKGGRAVLISLSSDGDGDSGLLLDGNEGVVETRGRRRRSLFGLNWAWHPRENLLYGTGYEAAAIAPGRTEKKVVEPFTGSMRDGLDIKATLRSYAKGNGRPHVRSRRHRRVSYRDAMSEPVVFLFSAQPMGDRAYWDLGQAALDLSHYVKDQPRYERIKEEKGTAFIANIAVSEPGVVEKRISRLGGSAKRLWGVTTFGNPCNHTLQAARWAEASDYKGFPILKRVSMPSLVNHYKQQYNVEMDMEDWTSCLIKSAIPFAKKRVVLLGSDEYSLPGNVRRDARRFGVEIDLVPLSRFSAQRVEAIRTQYYFETLDGDGLHFSKEIEEAMGEPEGSNGHLLPEWIRAQKKD